MKNKRTIIVLMMSMAVFNGALAHAGEAAKAEDMDPEFMAFVADIYGDPLEDAAIRLDEFAQRLQIDGHQSAAWEDFKAFFLAQISQKQQRMQALKESMKARRGEPMTSVEALELKSSILQQQLDDTQQAQIVVGNLYAQLNEVQQLKFDQTMRQLWFMKQQQRKR